MDATACPKCRLPLVTAKGPEFSLEVCMRCGGVHFDAGELARLVESGARGLTGVEGLVEPDEERLRMMREEQLICPSCTRGMRKYEYAYGSGVKLDRCRECAAIWVDDGELQGIEEHIAEEAAEAAERRPAEPVAPEPAAGERAIRTSAATALAGSLAGRG